VLTRDWIKSSNSSSGICQMSNHPISNRIAVAMATIMLLSAAPDGWSQTATYPVKVVRVVNPVAPGGNQETIARTIADQLTRGFGQPVVVESRPASSAIVGTRYVKSAPPDGYTLLAISNTFVRVPALMADPGYDPLKDFAAISLTGEVPLVLVVNPALPVKTVRELIALAKRKPGELTSASSGVGSTGHVATELFSRQAGIRMLNIQYKGAAPAVIDLVGGHVMLRFDQVTTSLPFIRTGKLRALGVSSEKRSPALPDVPTIAEAGLAGFHDTTFNGLMAPAGTPREVIERLRDGVAKAVAVTEVHNRLLEMGIELVASSSSEEFAAFLRKQVDEFAILAREAGIATR
jgi:tripartite-type tricarboxylate transporter receptor subunit TctC